MNRAVLAAVAALCLSSCASERKCAVKTGDGICVDGDPIDNINNAFDNFDNSADSPPTP